MNKHYTRCIYCEALQHCEEGTTPPGWQESKFKDCSSPLYVCPKCTEAEAKAAAETEAIWAHPDANRKHKREIDYLNALLPIARLTGWAGSIEELCQYECFREMFADGYTPADAMYEELQAAC